MSTVPVDVPLLVQSCERYAPLRKKSVPPMFVRSETLTSLTATVPVTVPSVFHRYPPAPKYITPVSFMTTGGASSPDLDERVFTIVVPDCVPSLFQRSKYLPS